LYRFRWSNDGGRQIQGWNFSKIVIVLGQVNGQIFEIISNLVGRGVWGA